MNPTELAQEAYTAWRSSFREAMAPPRWDALTNRERDAYICVAQWGFDAGVDERWRLAAKEARS